MELTGKCKEAFEKWLRDLHLDSDKRRIDTELTRHEARTAEIEKANELFNERS